MREHTVRNLDYYSRLSPGRADYWRYMAAPRFRVQVIRHILEREHPSSVVDLGCGDGALLAAIREVLPEAALAGIDLSPAQIAQNRDSVPDADWYVANLETDTMDLPRRFAALTASEVIEHLADPGRFLRNARQLAADGALLVLSTQSGTIRETERSVGHVHHFTAPQMTQLLDDNGWRTLRVWNSGFPFHDLSKWAANLLPGAMMQEFGEKAYGPVQRTATALLRFLFLFNSSSRGTQLFATARTAA